jgi:hypothetical protein
MDVHTKALQMYLAQGIPTAEAEQYAREHVALLRTLVREAMRQVREEAATHPAPEMLQMETES